VSYSYGFSFNIKLPDGRTIDKPHREYVDHELMWKWLLDSYESGDVYKDAVYGVDNYNFPVRNLIRHKREYPSPSPMANWRWGYDPATDDYEVRRKRTPVPKLLAEVIGQHLGKIYEQEVDRSKVESSVQDWHPDVDGRGTDVDCWVKQTMAPLLMTFGQLDIIADHPIAPADEVPANRADVMRLGLDTCVINYILPNNLIWWSLDRHDSYTEVIIRECDDQGEIRYRYWNAKVWALYDEDGNKVGSPTDHPFGRVPIIRLFDRRRFRCRNVGKPRYEDIAELQHAYYNKDSELTISDTVQAFPLLQAPQDFMQPDSEIPIGPGYCLPKAKVASGAGGYFYEGWDVVDFPKGGAESIRINLEALRDRIDRSALLTKPAGAAGTTGQTVAQSGLSKRLDQSSGNALLAELAVVLEEAEDRITELAYLVLHDGKEMPEGASEIAYPRTFNLYSADELSAAIIEFQAILTESGQLPETEEMLYTKLVKLMLPGLDDKEYESINKEIHDYLQTKAREAEARSEMTGLAGMVNGVPDPSASMTGATGPVLGQAAKNAAAVLGAAKAISREPATTGPDMAGA